MCMSNLEYLAIYIIFIYNKINAENIDFCGYLNGYGLQKRKWVTEWPGKKSCRLA